MLNTLSGRFLILTAAFVDAGRGPDPRALRGPLAPRLPGAEARGGADRLAGAARPATASTTSLERELLKNAGVYNVVLRRDEMRQLALVLADPRADLGHLRPARRLGADADPRRHRHAAATATTASSG